MARDLSGRTITLAGETHRIRYTLEEKEFIVGRAPSGEERQLGKLIFSDDPAVHKAIIYAGIKGANRKTHLTVDAVGTKMQEHNDLGGYYDRDVLLPCILEICDSRILGYGANTEGIKAYLQKLFADAEAEEEGKAAPVVAE